MLRLVTEAGVVSIDQTVGSSEVSFRDTDGN